MRRTNRVVNIWDRNGQLKKEIDIPGACVAMDWSKDGGLLAIIHDKSAEVILWDPHNMDDAFRLETGQKGPLTYLKWSEAGMKLAIGTSKGALVIYDHQTSRKIPVLGRHGNKAIICGAWSSDDQLCLGGQDKMCTISQDDGVILNALPLQADPSDIRFYERPSDADPDVMETTVSILLAKQNLYLWSSAESENPIELEFQTKYGSIVAYEWFGDRKIMIGFSSGHFIIVSTHMNQIGQELFQSRNHRKRLNHLCMSTALNKAATCGDDCIKIHDLTDPTETYGIIRLEREHGNLDKMDWSDDGQLLTISTHTGSVYTFLTKLPILGASYQTKICHLTALQEITVSDPGNPDEPKMKQWVPVEPSFVAIGPYHIATGLNNQAYFYVLTDEGKIEPLTNQVDPKTYMSTIDKLVMNAAYAAVLTDGRLHLHLIEGEEGNIDDDRDSILFPTNNQDSGRITCCALTSAFCIYGTASGSLFYFLLEDWVLVNEYKHEGGGVGIKMIFPDPSGTRLVFVDDKDDMALYNPVNDVVLPVPEMPVAIKGVLWDQQSENCFVAYDDKVLDTYVYRPDYMGGPRVEKIGSTDRSYGLSPINVLDGRVICLTQSGRNTEETLDTHKDAIRPDATRTHPKACALQNTALGRFPEAFVAAVHANDDQCWEELYTASLRCLDVTLARKCAQARGAAAAAGQLSSIEHIEDTNLLSGHVALMFNDIELAQKMFEASTEPAEALRMHADLLNWKVAMELADKYAPEEKPYISRESAQQMEFSGDFHKALKQYGEGITEKTEDQKHNNLCRAGMARMYLRNGDMAQGLALVAELNQKHVYRDCAAILQAIGQMNEAAQMYEKGDLPDKAAIMFMKLKNWAKVGELIKRVQSSKLISKYAQAREADGSYKEACDAYKQAGEFEAVIRISLDHLQDPDQAVKIVKETGSIEGAKLVAKFFMNLNDPASAIHFLVLSGASDDAFRLAQTHSKMDVFAEVLGEDGQESDYRSVAKHFESNGSMLPAGEFYMKAGMYPKALDLLLKCDDQENRHIDLAIQVVGRAVKQNKREEKLKDTLINYIMGETDGNPKDAKYLFQLYIALQKFPEAARTAVIIAREEQSAGNYRIAHGVLFKMHQTLEKEGVKIPMDMWNNLMILHSYIMVKVHIKRNDHLKAARLLVRVAENVSAFPAHVVNILTSTVIECWKAGLKNSACSYAAMLMRPEYRKDIDPKYKTKIEKIVRKPDNEELEEEMVTSPYDPNAKMSAWDLTCPSTNNVVPFCMVTGKAMTLDDWAQVPTCTFPGRFGGGGAPACCRLCLALPRASGVRHRARVRRPRCFALPTAGRPRLRLLPRPTTPLCQQCGGPMCAHARARALRSPSQRFIPS